MKCPVCSEQTTGTNHNGRGLRCTFCWALLPVVVDVTTPKPAPQVVAVPEKKEPAKPKVVPMSKRVTSGGQHAKRKS